MKWPTVKLGAVAKIVSGSTPKSGNAAFWGGDIPWATPTDLSGLATKELASTSRMITEAGLASCSAAMLPARSVLFSSRAPIGLVAINKDPLCTNQGFKSFVPDKARLSPDFLYWWLKCHRAALEHLGRGATFKEVSKSIIEAVEIPLPPLAEQKRIAEILDAADALRAKRREALAQLDALLQSTFLTLFGDPVTNPMGWPSEQIGNLGNVATGKTPPSKEHGMFGDEIPFATPSDLDHKLEYTERSITLAGAKFSKVVREGSTLVCCIGTLGKMARTPRQTAFNQQINAVEWNPEINDWFGLFAIGFCKKQMIANSSATTVPILNKTGFSKVEMLKPPLPLQQKFAAIVESIERQKTTQRAHLAELDALFAALQHRAFRGEL